jgi:hypothetical protein
MKLNINRSFDYKNEELPVVCGYGAISQARDPSDFNAVTKFQASSEIPCFRPKQ